MKRHNIQRPPAFLLLQLMSLLISIPLSISRIHDPIIPTIPNQQHTPPLTLSSTIPSLKQTIELAQLSSLVYYFRSIKAHDCTPFPDVLEWFSAHHSDTFRTDDATYRCHLYEHDAQDTQVIVLSRTANPNNGTATVGVEEEEELEDYVAVVYAGTDDFRTVLTDAHTRMTQFGPTNATAPKGVHVHAGFNNAVFGYDLMDRVLEAVRGVMEEDRQSSGGEGGVVVERKVFTTGHSLGGADSVLCAVALSSYFEFVTSVSIGCPKTGNKAWRKYVNSIPNVGVWRVVNHLDLVPRMPGPIFKHVGHTIQLGHKITKAYWLHEGDSDLGYRGVPYDWGASSYFLAPIAAYDHLISHYIEFLIKKCLSDEDRYYVNKFERIDGGDIAGVIDGNVDEYETSSSDIDDSSETTRKIAIESAEHYLEFLARDNLRTDGEYIMKEEKQQQQHYMVENNMVTMQNL